MKVRAFVLLAFLVASFCPAARAQSAARPKVAVFLPLYLDSAFDASGAWRYDKSFPKFINPGLEFYEGLQLAADSLDKEGQELDIRVFDTRASGRSVRDILADTAFAGTRLMVGHVTTAELHVLADAAAAHEIPFINVNYPADGGIVNNPYFVILNSTLKGHCEALYRFVQRNWATSPIVYISKKGAQEDRLKGYFADIEHATASVPLRIKYVTIADSADMDQAVLPLLAPGDKTVCIVGSMDEGFGKKVAAKLAGIYKKNPTKLFGMPTWDAIDFTQPAFAQQEIYYTTPFYFNAADTLVAHMNENFIAKFYARPSDMVFRGFKTMYHFGRLLAQYPDSLAAHIADRSFAPFAPFDLEPVRLDRNRATIDYYENRKIWYVKKVNGVVTNVY